MATHCVDYSVLWCLGSLGVCTSCALMKCVHLLIVLIDHITILIWTTNSPTTILIDLITTLIWTTNNHMHRERKMMLLGMMGYIYIIICLLHEYSC